MIKKVILLTEVISPYRIPVFNEIAQCAQIEFKVFFLAETVSGRLWNVEREKIRFEYRVLKGLKIPLPNRFPIFFNPGIGSILRKENPDLIISGGYHHPSLLLALRYARKYQKRFILWCETHNESVRVISFPAGYYRKNFIRSSDGFIVPGRKSFDFIRKFEVNGKGIWIAPNAVHNDFFSQSAVIARSQSKKHKLQRGFPSQIILYVGRMVDSKGIPVLLRAFQDISNSPSPFPPPTGRGEGEGIGLVLVGEGKDQVKYKTFCQKHNLKNVFFEGFKQQEELSFYYGLADLFVLPSTQEEWGLVLNEAAASGLPLIATEASGAAFDLIDEGKNGFRVPVRDAQALRDAILKVLSDVELKKSMGAYSRKKVEEFSPQKCAEGIIQAILDGVQK